MGDEGVNWDGLFPATTLSPDWAEQYDAAETDSERASTNPLHFIIDVLSDKEQNILVVDEDETFSTSLALAAMRKTFNRIWVASNISMQETVDHKFLNENIAKNANNARKIRDQPRSSVIFRNCGLYQGAGNINDWALSLRRQRSDDFSAFEHRCWADDIAKTPSLAQVPKDVIWLNHPWISPATGIAHYIKSFLKACSHLQTDGDIVLLTLTRNPRWCGYYDVEGLLACARQLGYQVYWDHEFMHGVFDFFGYRHLTWNQKNDIHTYVIPVATTLIH